MARFIGGTNIFRGTKSNDDTVICAGGFALRCGSGDFATNGETAVSVRHHDIEVRMERPNAETNAISGIVLVGALIAAGTEHRDLSFFLGFAAIIFATVNVVGGFLVTDSMLRMFKRKR